ncbi:hypothetical protein X747_12665 [Mesorhizobium sp. LNJC384A00]|nr:hypothetical protein X747_12665 [Mesorhizobium sp. LNJC384A00]
MDQLLFHVFNELLMENEPHIELDDFCRFLVEALELKIDVKGLGKEGVRFRSVAEFDNAEGVSIDLTIPRELRKQIEPLYLA